MIRLPSTCSYDYKSKFVIPNKQIIFLFNEPLFLEIKMHCGNLKKKWCSKHHVLLPGSPNVIKLKKKKKKKQRSHSWVFFRVAFDTICNGTRPAAGRHEGRHGGRAAERRKYSAPSSWWIWIPALSVITREFISSLSHSLTCKMEVGRFQWHSGCQMWVLESRDSTCPRLLVPLSPGGSLGSAGMEWTCPPSSLCHLDGCYTRAPGWKCTASDLAKDVEGLESVPDLFEWRSESIHCYFVAWADCIVFPEGLKFLVSVD